MEPRFWQQRWEADEIGFHQDTVNPYLQRHWPALGVSPETSVFVPLCGKSRDMLWLRERGHEVRGVEVVPQAVAAFFAENGMTPVTRREGAFEVWEAEGYTLCLGDFFALTPAQAGPVDAVYDRASLIALPPPLRARYAAHLLNLLRPGARVLLVTMEYAQTEMNGPPFAVTEAEVRHLYEPHCEVSPLSSEDVLAANPRFRARGLTRLEEKSYLLVRR